MHLLKVTYKDGVIKYCGPFPTFFLANRYGESVAKQMSEKYLAHEVIKMILPGSIVRQVIWR